MKTNTILKSSLVSLVALGAVGCAMEARELTDEELLEISQDIVKGSINWAGKAYERNRTVYIRTPLGKICSGTLLLPNAVLTARHCITTDGTIQGPVADASNVRVRIRSAAPAPAANDLCTGASRDATCSIGVSLHRSSITSIDMVLVELEAPLSHPDLSIPFTPLETGVDEATYVGTNRIDTGWGMNTCSNGQGTLRWGQTKIGKVNDTATIDGTSYSGLIRLDAGSSDQNIYEGDSGGPTWGTSAPFGVIGVHSGANCDSNDGGTEDDEGGTAWDVSVARNFSLVRNWLHNSVPSSTDVALSSLSDVNTIGSNWSISGGKLKQTGNGADRMALLRDVAFHGTVNQEHKVKIQGSDDDHAGVVLNYFDNDNYIVCEANEELQRLRLWARYQGSYVTIKDTTWTGDFGTTVTVSATTDRTSSNEIDIICKASGGGASTKTTTGRFAQLGAGRTGVYNHFNQNISYWDFEVNKLSL